MSRCDFYKFIYKKSQIQCRIMHPNKESSESTELRHWIPKKLEIQNLKEASSRCTRFSSLYQACMKERDLVLVDVEAAELLLLPFAGDGEWSGNEVVEKSPYHTAMEVKDLTLRLVNWRLAQDQQFFFTIYWGLSTHKPNHTLGFPLLSAFFFSLLSLLGRVINSTTHPIFLTLEQKI